MFPSQILQGTEQVNQREEGGGGRNSQKKESTK